MPTILEAVELEVSYTWWECKLVPPLYKTVWNFFKKLKIELPII